MTGRRPSWLDGKLIVYAQGRARRQSRMGTRTTRDPANAGKPGTACLIAYDALTGKKVWRAELPYPGPRHGTPVAVRLSNGTETMDVMATAGGAVVRADDGHVLLRDIEMHYGFAENDFDSPIVRGDTIYYTHGHSRLLAARLIMQDRDYRGREDDLGDIRWEGSIRRLGSRRGPPVPAGQGRLVEHRGAVRGQCRDRPHLGEHTGIFPNPRSDPWTPPSVCGAKQELLAIMDSWRGLNRCPNHMVFVSLASSRPRVLARSEVELSIAAPIFEADRVYVRSFGSLTCYGREGDEGRRFETDMLARVALGRIPPRFADDGEPVSIQASGAWADFAAWPTQDRMVDNWRLVGGFPVDLRDSVRTAVGHPAWKLRAEEKSVTVSGVERPVARFNAKENYLQDRPDKRWWINPYISVRALTDAKPGEVVFCHALVHLAAQTVRLDLDTPGVQAWLSGTPVRHGQRIQPGEGYHDLVLEVEIGNAGRDGDLRVLFRRSDSVDEERERRAAAIEEERNILAKAALELPDTETGRRCAALLAELQ